jgi:hypothetical protein
MWIGRISCMTCKNLSGTIKGGDTLLAFSEINDWLFTVLRPAQEYFSYMETSSIPLKGYKIWFMLNAQGLWAGRDLYHATPAVTERGLSFSGLIQGHSTAPFIRLLQYTRGCGESILTCILMGPYSVTSYNTQGGVENLFLPGPHRVSVKWGIPHWLECSYNKWLSGKHMYF